MAAAQWHGVDGRISLMRTAILKPANNENSGIYHMKQLNRNAKMSISNVPSLAQIIATEFVRIAKLAENGKGEEAWRAANALYKKHPNDHTANIIMALILIENNRKADALPYAKAAVKLAPNNTRYLVSLGKLYLDLGMIEFAPAVLHKAFALDKTLYQVPWVLAYYYLSSGQGSRALPYFKLALQAAPTALSANIRLDRAECLSSIGRPLEAEDDLTFAMGEPKYRVHALVESALLQWNDYTSEYAKQVRKELELSDLTDKDRSSLLLCLGRLHENGRDYDNAFLNFERSRKLLNSEFNAAVFLSQIDDTLNVLTRDVFEKFKEFGHESGKPIFIVGMPRSGTTLTEQIIAAHSQVEGVGEHDRIHILAKMCSQNRGLRQTLNKMTEAGPERWKDVPQQYLNLVNALAPDAHRAVDKTPTNFIHLGFIHLCFPNAKIIHCKRNPLDNFISAFQNKMNPSHGYSYDQVKYGEYYINYLRAMDHWKEVLSGSIYESQYEALTANPEVEVRKILNFLALPWEDACLKFSERESTVRTLSRQQVRNPINTGSVARWRNYQQHLGPIIAVLEQSGVQI